MKLKILLIVTTSCLMGFEVNTHQALTRCAIKAYVPQCSTEGTQNLETFIGHSGLKYQSYASEIFSPYGKTYQAYVQTDTESKFNNWNIKVGTNYLGMIESGVVLEDAVYPISDHAGDGRFNNHFYAVQIANTKDACKKETLSMIGPMANYRDMRTAKTLCGGYGVRTDNIDWVFNNSRDLYWKGHSRKNEYGLHDAFGYFKNSFIGTNTNRRKNQAKLFVTLGHMVHMIQDLHSPAHCRDNAHANGDYLEIYGRYNGGFNLINGTMNTQNNRSIEAAIRNFSMKQVMLKDNRYSSYQDFFSKEADWVSKNFFSEAHGIYADVALGFNAAYLSLDKKKNRNTSIFDKYNALPSRSAVNNQDAISGAITNVGGDARWYYMKSLGNNSYVKGNINPSHNVIGLVEKGYFGSWPTMMEVTKKWGNPAKYNDYNKKALVDTAVNVMPRAVASTQAFINFFFRGQISASINTEGILTIKNVSDPQLVSDARLLIFKGGGKFSIYYYEPRTKENIPLNYKTYTFGDIAIGETRTLNLKSDFLRKNLPVGTKITVLYDGNIGTNLGGNDSYGIGMRGLSVDVAILPIITKPEIPTPDVYSFSVSGRNEQFPDYYNSVANFSFDVHLYKNSVYQGKLKLDNLLKLVWYDGSAHFHNSSIHHFDVWCQGHVQLCNYLRSHVPTDTRIGYENWVIDWTVWNYGVYANNGSYFIFNIRNAIAQYYTLSYASQKNSAKVLDIQDEKIQLDWISNGKKIPLGVDLMSANRSDVKVEIIESNQTETNHETKDTALEKMQQEADEAEKLEIQEAEKEQINRDKPLEDDKYMKAVKVQ